MELGLASPAQLLHLDPGGPELPGELAISGWGVGRARLVTRGDGPQAWAPVLAALAVSWCIWDSSARVQASR